MNGPQIPLSSIRGALRGVLPSAIATSSSDGIPNVTCLSMVLYVDEERIALSNQFMNKTSENLHENPQVAIPILDPETMHEYDLDARYVRSEASGGVVRLDASPTRSPGGAGGHGGVLPTSRRGDTPGRRMQAF